MTEIGAFDPSSTPTGEVRVYRGSDVIASEWCDSEDAAAEAVARWSEQPGLRCVVHDLVAPAGVDAAEIGPLDEEPLETDEGYPRATAGAR